LTPDPTGGAYNAAADPLVVFRKPTSKGSGGEGKGQEERERGREGVRPML